MAKNEVILRFDKVSFEYGVNKPILDEVSFPLRTGSKITIMGQNGAGKSTIFGLITGKIKPESGCVTTVNGLTIATSKQVLHRDEMHLTVREFFEKCFAKKVYDIDPRIDDVLEVVNLKGHEKLHDRVLKTFSGGQQARILLASGLIQLDFLRTHLCDEKQGYLFSRPVPAAEFEILLKERRALAT